MSTKTIRLPPRRFLTPSKRKERDGFNNNSVKPSITTPTAPPPPPPTIPSKLPKLTTAGADLEKPPTPPPEPDKSNQLLAGYLAHEFLSKGTLFGQPFDPPAAARPEIVAKKEVMSSQKAELEPSRGGGGGKVEPRKDKCERYVDISGLLKREGVHIQGIVNPTQLARFLQM